MSLNSIVKEKSGMFSINVEIEPEVILQQFTTDQIIQEFAYRLKDLSINRKCELWEDWNVLYDFTIDDLIKALDAEKYLGRNQLVALKELMEWNNWFVYEEEPPLIPQNNSVFDEDIKETLDQLHEELGYKLPAFLEKVYHNRKYIQNIL